MFVICSVFDMASSSSSSFNFDVVCGLHEKDVLWMQKQHVSQHNWNKDVDKKIKNEASDSNLSGYRTTTGRNYSSVTAVWIIHNNKIV